MIGSPWPMASAISAWRSSAELRSPRQRSALVLLHGCSPPVCGGSFIHRWTSVSVSAVARARIPSRPAACHSSTGSPTGSAVTRSARAPRNARPAEGPAELAADPAAGRIADAMPRPRAPSPTRPLEQPLERLTLLARAVRHLHRRHGDHPNTDDTARPSRQPAPTSDYEVCGCGLRIA